MIAKSAVLVEIERRFREEGIEIPFPQRDLHIRSVHSEAAEAVVGRPSAGDGARPQPPSIRGGAHEGPIDSTNENEPRSGVQPGGRPASADASAKERDRGP